MDIFRFTNPTAPMKMEQGVLVNNLKSKMWIERYLPAGEFTFVADANSDARTKLPIGSFVSHSETTEVMIVEDHSINDSVDGVSEITITGRGFETFLENRIVGSNKIFPVSGGDTDHVLLADFVPNQAIALIEYYTLLSNLIDPGDEVPFMTAMSIVADAGENVSRSIQVGELYTRVLELLSLYNLGIRIVRPGPASPLGPFSPNTALVIHNGTDRTNEIVFSSDTGEIGGAAYLWSNKMNKNAALVKGRFVQTMVTTTEEGYNRRVMPVDASDIDDAFTEPPTGTDLDNVVYAMQQRGKLALASQIDIALTNIEVSKNAGKAKFRRDFEVGDLIRVNGSFNATSIQRVSEYAEIEDSSGQSGYPTLTEV